MQTPSSEEIITKVNEEVGAPEIDSDIPVSELIKFLEANSDIQSKLFQDNLEPSSNPIRIIKNFIYKKVRNMVLASIQPVISRQQKFNNIALQIIKNQNK